MQFRVQEVAHTQVQIDHLSSQFGQITDSKERLGLLLTMGRDLPRLAEASKTPLNRVMGCAAQVHILQVLRNVDIHDQLSMTGHVFTQLS